MTCGKGHFLSEGARHQAITPSLISSSCHDDGWSVFARICWFVLLTVVVYILHTGSKKSPVYAYGWFLTSYLFDKRAVKSLMSILKLICDRFVIFRISDKTITMLLPKYYTVLTGKITFWILYEIAKQASHVNRGRENDINGLQGGQHTGNSCKREEIKLTAGGSGGSGGLFGSSIFSFSFSCVWSKLLRS